VTKGEGDCRITGVEVGEIHIDFFTPQPTVSAKYAHVNVDSGQRLGSSYSNTWSLAVMQKLEELRALMEQEVCNNLFAGGSTSGGGPTPPTLPDADEIPAL
jgi:hypothetical protein